MKRTIQEVMDLLEQKRESAKLDMKRYYENLKTVKDQVSFVSRDNINRLSGEYDAYTDVICLIASSHLLDGGQHEEN